MLDVAGCVDVKDWPSKDLMGPCNDLDYGSGGNILAGNGISDIAFAVMFGAAVILAL